MSKLKIILLLLLSVNVFGTAPEKEAQKTDDKELTTRQKVFIYSLATGASLYCATELSKKAVSCLPEKTSLFVKVGVFMPIEAILLVGLYYNFLKSDELGFYKRHKWLLLGL